MDVLNAEIDPLKRCFGGLSGILAADGLSKDIQPAAAIARQLDSLLTVLDLQMVQLRLARPIEGLAPEMLRRAAPASDREVSMLTLPLGVDGELGSLSVGATRNGFPDTMDRKLIEVAGLKATNALLTALHAAENRQRDEEIARYKKDLLHQLVDSIAAEVTLSTPEGEIVFVNQTCIARTGRPSSTHSDWGTSDLLHPDDLPRVKEAWERALATTGAYECDVRSLCADGVYRWVHSHGFPIKDAQGKVINWCTLHLDINDQKEAQAVLAASEQRLDLVVNTIPAMVWTADTGGNVDFFNRHFLDYVGQPMASLMDGGWKSTVHPEDIERLLATWKSVMATTQSGEAEARLRRFDGVYRRFLMRVNPLYDETGKVVRWYGVNTDIDDWSQTRESLRASELMLNSMVDSIAAPLGFFKPNGELEVVNQMVLDYFGVPFGALADWDNIVHPEDLSASRAAWDRSIQTGKPYVFEARIRHRDGTYRWNDHRGYPMRDADGKIVRWCVLQLDVHDRKEVEARLAESERNLDQVISVIPGLVWSSNPDGAATFLNQHYLDYLGRPAEELLGWGYASAVHPDDIERLTADWQGILASEQPGELEARLRRHDGEYRWFLFRGSPVRDDSGKVIKWHGVNTDIHDRKQAEESLRRQEFLMGAMRESIAVPMSFWTPAGQPELVNHLALEYFGRPINTVDDWISIVHPDDHPGGFAKWQSAVASGLPYFEEIRLLRADGAYRWNDVRNFPMRDNEGTIVRWCVIQIDIDDRKRAENALAASERRLQMIIDAIPALVWSAHSDGSAEFVNQHYLDYVGMTMEEVRTWGWTKAVHPDDLPDFIARWQKILETGSAGENQARLRRADGEYRWFMFRGSPVVDDAGEVKWFGINVDIEERKRAEEAVRESELNLRQQTETIPQMLWSARPDGSFEYCNARFLNYTGSAGTVVMGDGWKNALHPDDRAATARAWKHSVETGEAYQVEVRKFCAEAGEYHWCLTSALPLRDASGRIIKWHGASIDIHDQKLAEQALAASERKLKLIINTIPAMAWSANPDGTCDFFNQNHLDYVGLPMEEMCGIGFVKTFHPDDLPQLMGPWQEMLATGRGGEVEGRIRNRDGEYRRFLFRTNPLFDDDKLIKWFGVNIDIEDRKRAEEAVRESELNLRQLTETIPQMLWSTKPDGRVDYSNTRLQEFMGITAEDFADHGWADCLHPDDREPTARLWAHCVATGTPYRTEARFCYGGKGSYRWCLTTGLPLRDDTGRIVRWHGACVDLHDWKAAQDELRETQAELAHMTRVTTMGQLTASIAHELNQPLAGIMTNASTGMRMLNADPPNVAGARETARRTLRDAGRASEVINRLRALFTKKSTTFEAVDLNLAIQEVIALTSTELQRNGVSLRTELADDLPPVAGDRIQLQQVILNFIMNGTEAMNSVEDRAREMVISTQQDETGYIRLSVKDTGVGFDASSTEKLFSPFFTTKSSGMGIGLSVSRSIIESHQGRLWAEANPGSGATFSFALPFQPGQELADGGHRRHVETSIGAGMIGNP